MNGTKRARTYSEDSEGDDSLKETLEKLESIQKDIDSLNVSAAQDIIKIEEVYTKKRKTHFEQRSELLRSIPKFWVTVNVLKLTAINLNASMTSANKILTHPDKYPCVFRIISQAATILATNSISFQNHPHMSLVMKDEEIECLGHLSNIVVDENEKIGSGYRIHFYFLANPFFENEVITKEFIIQPMTLTVSANTPILWKEGKELSKPTWKSKGRKRRRERMSFFRWIQDHSDPDNDDIAEIIKEELWFNPLQFYCLVGDEEQLYSQNSSELRKNGEVDDGDADEVEIIDEEEVEEEEEDEELDEEEEVEDEELLEEDGNEEEVTVIVDEDDECEDE